MHHHQRTSGRNDGMVWSRTTPTVKKQNTRFCDCSVIIHIQYEESEDIAENQPTTQQHNIKQILNAGAEDKYNIITV